LLREHGVRFELLVLPFEVHSFARAASWTSAFERASAFLGLHLRSVKR
jgi:dipeptidyl aminopeptidase/acylaminoacyl peptidase